MDQNLRTMNWNVTTIDQNLRTMDWNVTTMDQNLRTIDWNVTTMDQNLRTMDSLSFALLMDSWFFPPSIRISYVLKIIQIFYYPVLAMIGVPGKSVYPVVNFMNILC